MTKKGLGKKSTVTAEHIQRARWTKNGISRIVSQNLKQLNSTIYAYPMTGMKFNIRKYVIKTIETLSRAVKLFVHNEI